MNLGANAGRQECRARRGWWLLDVVALTLILLVSARVDTLGAPSRVSTNYLAEFRFHHWGAAVGPAELVRQGGWLLWDVPSSYGFLSTLAIAWLPFRSVWQSYYVLHLTLTALTAGMLYTCLRSLRSGPTNRLFALVVTGTVVFLISGSAQHSTGPSTHPPLTAFRHFWSYVLVTILVAEYRDVGRSGSTWMLPLCGNLAWVLGTLWSPESAVYGCATWLPAYLVMSWDRARSSDSSVALSLARWLALPVVMLGGTIGMISVWYRIGLGHFPDWARYWDYLLSFTYDGIYMEQAHRPDGVVWILVLCLCGLSTFAVVALRRGEPKLLALAAGLWGMVWANSGYFVMRTGEVPFLNLGTVLVTCMVLCLAVMAREPSYRRVAPTIRASLIPVLTVLITMSLGNDEHLGDWPRAMRRGYVRSVDGLMPQMDPALARLLRQAGVRPDDPIEFLNNDGGVWSLNALPLWPPAAGSGSPRPHWQQRAWTPALPFVLFRTLTRDRPEIYMRRFTERTGLGGWLIESRKTSARAAYPGFFDTLARTHRPIETIEDESWRLTRFERLPQVAARHDRGTTRR
jgi:hypothetical protein